MARHLTESEMLEIALKEKAKAEARYTIISNFHILRKSMWKDTEDGYTFVEPDINSEDADERFSAYHNEALLEAIDGMLF